MAEGFVVLSHPPISIGFVYTGEADPSVPVPDYASHGAAGFDFRANLAAAHRANGLSIAPGQRALVPTGLRVAIPDGYEIQMRPRSGLAMRHGITCLNSPGTIDADYRGEIGIILANFGAEAFLVVHGERIAQGVLAPVYRGRFTEVARLGETGRGTGAFGSTGR